MQPVDVAQAKYADGTPRALRAAARRIANTPILVVHCSMDRRPAVALCDVADLIHDPTVFISSLVESTGEASARMVRWP
jgi:hypothetical protein